MPSPRPKFSLLLTALFAFLGFADAAYLTADHYLSLPVPCALTGGCETVLKSAYATIGPVPIALLGALYYLAALFLAVHIYTSIRSQPRAAQMIFLMSAIGVLASGYLMYVQAGILKAFCQYCLVSALTSVLLCISSFVLWRRLLKSSVPDSPAAATLLS